MSARDISAIPWGTLSGTDFDLRIGETSMNFTGQPRTAVTVNGSVPAPTLRWREGDTVTVRVANTLNQDASIHWHGIVLPANMDGVPGLSFQGIRPEETYVYRFTVRQASAQRRLACVFATNGDGSSHPTSASHGSANGEQPPTWPRKPARTPAGRSSSPV